MAIYHGSLSKVRINIGLLTLDWLKTNQIEFDKIIFVKLNADVYIDDRAFRVQSWEQIDGSFVEESKFE